METDKQTTEQLLADRLYEEFGPKPKVWDRFWAQYQQINIDSGSVKMSVKAGVTKLLFSGEGWEFARFRMVRNSSLLLASMPITGAAELHLVHVVGCPCDITIETDKPLRGTLTVQGVEMGVK